tara:strand:- start:5661 stop:6242 length:582 start_codon:yes stop_codon:yes gene_type:complete
MSNRVLFISARCPHSKKILVGIQQYPFLKDLFKIVNIDREPYPNYIKTVPSILINNQVVTGNSVFEYFGKLVDGKKEQEERESTNQLNDSDQGQCRINEDGMLEGYCGSDMGLGFSAITEENDDYTKKTYEIDQCLSFLEGGENASIQDQVKSMEEGDGQINEKKQQFDNDLERMQKERNEIGGGGGGPPMMR